MTPRPLGVVVDLDDTLEESAGPPTVTPSTDWKTWLATQDVAPQVSGFASSGGSDANSRTRFVRWL